MGCRPPARSVLHCHGVLALRDRSLSEALLAVLEGVRLVSRQFRKRRLALWAALVRVQLYKLVASTCNITLRPSVAATAGVSVALRICPKKIGHPCHSNIRQITTFVLVHELAFGPGLLTPPVFIPFSVLFIICVLHNQNSLMI